MKMFRMTLICLALIAGTSALSFAQGGRPERSHRDGDGDKDKGRDHDDDRDHGRRDRDDEGYRNSAAYQDGLKFGRKDAEHHKNNHSQHKRWKSNDDVRAYEAGYERGYRDANGYRNGNNGGYNNGGYNNGGYGNGYPTRNAGNPGFNMGSQDGSNDGRADRMAGRPFKYGPGYNHPDRGYNNSLGDKDTYQQQYRLGYQQAYQQAYGRR